MEENLEPKCLELKVLHLVAGLTFSNTKEERFPVTVCLEFLLCVPPPLPSSDTAWSHDRDIVQMPVNQCEIKHQMERQ